MGKASLALPCLFCICLALSGVLHAQLFEPTNGPVGATGNMAENRLGNLFFFARNSLHRLAPGDSVWTHTESLPWLDSYYVMRRLVGTSTPSDIFVHDLDVWDGDDSRLLRSRDSGESWDELPFLGYCNISEILVSNVDVIYLAVKRVMSLALTPGLYRSLNDGASFQPANWGMTPICGVLAIEQDQQGTLWVGTEHEVEFGIQPHVYRSFDHGDSWNLVSVNERDAVDVLEITARDSSIYVAATDSIYRTDDFGVSWINLIFDLPVSAEHPNVYIQTFGIDDDGWLFADLDGPGYIGSNLFKLAPLSEHWEAVDVEWELPPTGSTRPTILETETGELLASASDGSGPYATTDHGTTWAPFNTGLAHRRIDKIFRLPYDRMLAAGEYLWISSNGGDDWTVLMSEYIAANATPDGRLFVQTTEDTLLRSSDGGDNWTVLAAPACGIERLIVAPSGALLAGHRRPCRSEDNGQSWVPSYDGIPDYGDDSDGKLIALPSGHILFLASGDVYRSLDDGYHWLQLSGDGFSSRDLYAATVDASGSVYVSAEQDGIFRSDDEGITWTEMNDGFADRSSYYVYALEAIDDGTVYTSDRVRIYRKAAADDSWELIDSTSVPYGYIYGFTVDHWRRLMLATQCHSVYRSIDPVLGADESLLTVPQQVHLHPNYPNPFNPTTTLSFDLPSQQPVVLTIHNLLGQRVETLLDSRLHAGTHTLEWNASALPSGTYFCKLNTPTQSVTRRLTLVK